MSLVTKVSWRHFALIVLLASVARGTVLLLTHDLLSADPDAYRRIAHCIAIHGTFGLESESVTGLKTANPTAFRPPLYPWLISRLADPTGNIPNFPIAIAHWLLGTATAAGTYLLATRMLRGEADENTVEPTKNVTFASFLAAGLVAIDPLLLQASSLVMTETLAAGLVVLVLWLWSKLIEYFEFQFEQPRGNLGLSGYKKVSVLMGVAFGLAYLCRPTFILWPVIIAGYLLGLSLMQRCHKPFVSSFIILAVVAAFVAAWTMRNMAQFGQPIWATTHGGYTLLLGNNESFYDYLRNSNKSARFPFANAWEADFFIDRWDRRFDQDPREASFWDASKTIEPGRPPSGSTSELADDKLAYETAMATIKRRPDSFLTACFWRIRRLHSPFPLQSSGRPLVGIFAVAGFYTVTMTLVLIGIWRLGRTIFAPRWAASIALWVAIASVHTVYWTDMRMRAPAVPILSILAAVTVMSRPQGIAKNLRVAKNCVSPKTCVSPRTSAPSKTASSGRQRQPNPVKLSAGWRPGVCSCYRLLNQSD